MVQSEVEKKLDDLSEEVRKLKVDLINIVKILKKMDGYN